MKIVMTLLVRDEEDIIRENIEFHLSQGVSFFIVTDNLSVDGTADILKEYEGRGILHYLFEDNDQYDQYRWVTKMAVMAFREYGADWVINNDADEFWWPKSGNLIETFRKIPEEINVLEADRTNFVMVESSNASFYERMIYRLAVSLNSLGRPLPPKVAHRGNANVMVSPGNHSVSGFPKINMMSDAIDILHFPMRSHTQFENKIKCGGAAYERNETLPREIGITWRELYSEYQAKNGLREYCNHESYDSARIKEELTCDRIIKDCRLLDYLSRLNGLQ